MVSVIIPAYNMEKYIGRSLDAIISQTYSDLEIIVVDDGSVDDTYSIVEKYTGIDNRIAVYHKENGGVSSARNLGIEKATGEYIYFSDPDDLIERDAIEILVRSLEESDADIVSCQYSRMDEQGRKLDDYNFITGERNFVSDDERLSFLIRELSDYLVGYEVWNKMYRAWIIKDNHLRFPEQCKVGEDLAFNIRCLMYASKIYSIPDRCVRYTVRSDSAMGRHKKLEDKIFEDTLLLEDIRDFAIQSDNKTILENFPVIFVKLIEHSYVGHTPQEVIEAIKKIPDLSFIEQRYKEIDSKKEEIISFYPDEIARLKYRYHLLVRAKLFGGERLIVRSNSFIYDLYRMIRWHDTLGNWKMPY